ncbi:MAG: DUF885 family protein [Acidobacteria bacterium]|nr:DUF885 family protein [Acidobacteriota bacterium]
MHSTGTPGRTRTVCAALLAAAAAVALSSGLVHVQTTNPQFDALIDKYLLEVRGVGARSTPNDLSAGRFASELETQKRLLKELEAIDRRSLSFDEDIDYRFLKSLLEGNIIQDERVPRWKQNPRVYLNTRPISYRLESDPRDPAVRAQEITEELKLLQARLVNGKKNLTEHIPRWVELSLAMLDGTLAIVDREIPQFARRVGGGARQALETEARKASAALTDFRTFLTTEMPRKPQGDWKVGADVFNALHEKKYLFDDDDFNLRRIARGTPNFTRVPNYHDWGWRQFRVVERALEVQARKIDPTRSWLQIIRDMKQEHAPLEGLVYSHLEATRKSREWTIEQDLVTIPWDDDDDIMVAAPPSFAMAQWWGFAGTVPAGSKSRKSGWTMILPSPDWSDEMIDANLTEKDFSFMWVIATHEAYPGHHLQRLYQNENPRRLRVYESSYSNQSWCYYIEWDLTPPRNFYPADKQELYTLEMLRLKLWRMGRVIIDSGLHTGRMGYDEALQLENERIGFVRRGAQINIDGITERGSMWGAPTVGYFEWMLLREDYFKKMRELDQKGTLKDFHDRVYKIGFLPVTLVREALFHELERDFRPRASTAG